MDGNSLLSFGRRNHICSFCTPAGLVCVSKQLAYCYRKRIAHQKRIAYQKRLAHQKPLATRASKTTGLSLSKTTCSSKTTRDSLSKNDSLIVIKNESLIRNHSNKEPTDQVGLDLSTSNCKTLLTKIDHQDRIK
ncbi:hypothetical protein MJO28_008746 [Puccinia striiformis f. sp. tritici]|uniref:Uncharacterized protein n=1 Tax=Puccinia striiformis f. sp. tritici TaxID=168172 RepID=A0ACC0EDE3_9BASI|nr:hypothetical protein MJO28_008746 [Puccinia striiformis f. sp. tritici]